MNPNISLSSKIRVKNMHKNIPEIELNISKIKYQKRRYSISPKTKIISSIINDSPKNKNYSFYFNMYKNKAKELSFITKATSSKLFRRRISFDNNNVSPKRRSQEISHTKTQKFIQKYNLKIEDKIKIAGRCQFHRKTEKILGHGAASPSLRVTFLIHLSPRRRRKAMIHLKHWSIRVQK